MEAHARALAQAALASAVLAQAALERGLSRGARVHLKDAPVAPRAGWYGLRRLAEAPPRTTALHEARSPMLLVATALLTLALVNLAAPRQVGRRTRSSAARVGSALAIAAAFTTLVATTSVGAGPRSLATVPIGVVWFPTATVTVGMTRHDATLLEQLCVADHGPPAHCQRMIAWQLPARKAALRPYGIDREEVSVRAYRRCVARGACSPRHLENDDERVNAPNHPVTGVSIEQASRYCSSVGGRLPSEGEWERAGRGHHGRSFPWGNTFVRGLANHGSLTIRAGVPSVRGDAVDGYQHAAPTDALLHGASAAGVLNLAGNAREWVGDSFGTFEGAVSGLRTVKGGSWRSPRYELVLSYREPETNDGFAADLGFRCAYEGRTMTP